MVPRRAHAILASLALAALGGCSILLDFGAAPGDAGGPDPAADADLSCAMPSTFYADADGDGFGDPGAATAACAAPAGHVVDATDCDDGAAASHPGADELCDGADNDCNQTIDDGACRLGCADGQREGFVDPAAEPRIAGCAGGFGQPGLLDEQPPTCQRGGGDDADALGTSCRASDLCAVGWHVCRSPAEVAASASAASCAAAVPGGVVEPLFFATRQSGPGDGLCGAGANDLVGCGNVGMAPADASCAPLDRLSGELCVDLGPSSPWDCGLDGTAEAIAVRKLAATHGGVLCCRDAP